MTTQLLRSETLMQRHPDNPLIRPSDLGNADAVLNCGQTVYKGQTLLLLPVCPRGGTPVMHIARSSDGIHFDVDPEPFITPVDDAKWRDYDVWCIDPRITRIEDTYYICRPIETPVGTAALLEKTKDWKTRELVDCIAMPCNRVPSLFPERIDGLYYRLDRPYTGVGQPSRGEVWLSSSPDLIHWERHRRRLEVLPWGDAPRPEGPVEANRRCA